MAYLHSSRFFEYYDCSGVYLSNLTLIFLMNNKKKLMILYIGKSKNQQAILSNNLKKTSKGRRQQKLINNPHSEFFAIYSRKNNWHVTFKEELSEEEISLGGQSNIFVLVPEGFGQLLSYLSYFSDCRLLRPWVCCALVYNFYSNLENIANIVGPINCKIFRRSEIKKLSEYITSMEKCLV